MILLTDQTIDPAIALKEVREPACGAVACFEGNIRRENGGRAVTGLEYEVYPRLFHAEVNRIEAEARAKWQVHRTAIIQRVGKLQVGETGIFLAVSSPHRREALEACAYFIEEFKKRAPVWKREFYAEGSEWVLCRHGENADHP